MLAAVESDATINEKRIDWDTDKLSIDKFRIGNQLSLDLQQDMRQFFTAYSELFSEQLGCITLVKYKL